MVAGPRDFPYGVCSGSRRVARVFVSEVRFPLRGVLDNNIKKFKQDISLVKIGHKFQTKLASGADVKEKANTEACCVSLVGLCWRFVFGET